MEIKTMNFIEATDYKKHNHDSDVRRINLNWTLGMDLVKYVDHSNKTQCLGFDDVEAEDWVVMKDGKILKLK